MNTFRIYYGAPRPMVARGRHQCRLLSFAERFRCWHHIGQDRASKRAAARLAELGYLEPGPDGAFRFTYPKGPTC